jgi:5'-3' exonuclease
MNETGSDSEQLVTGFENALKNSFPEAFAPEIVNGCNVEEAAESVMLDVAYSPVIVTRGPNEWPCECVLLENGDYRVYYDNVTLELKPREVRVMRARYLLRRGELYRMLPHMDPEVRRRVEQVFFDGHAFVPAEGSILRQITDSGNPATIELNGRDPLEVIKGLMEDAGAKGFRLVAVKQPEPVLPKREPEIYAAVELPAQGSRHLVAFDVPSLRRIFYGMQKGEGPKPGAVVEAVCKELARMLRARQPTHAIFAFEGDGSIREEESKEYKASRKPSPAELVRDEQAVKNILIALLAPVYAPLGFEADDVLAAAARLCRGLSEEEKLPVVVMTPDKDMGQIVDDAEEVMLWDGAKGGNVSAAIGAAQILKRWKVPPWRLGDLLALAGDEGDGISGVPGWGPAKAAELLNGSDGKTLAELLRGANYYWVPAKYRKVFQANTERIRVCRELVRLRDECLPDLTIEALRVDALGLAEKLIEEGRRYAKNSRA